MEDNRANKCYDTNLMSFYKKVTKLTSMWSSLRHSEKYIIYC